VERSKVAVLKTSPESVLDDYGRLMQLAEVQRFLPAGPETILKINLSWHIWYPACSTTPWQLEGVAKYLRQQGYRKLIAGHNSTVVVDAHAGEPANHLRGLSEHYELERVFLNDEGVEWITYEPRKPFLVLDKVYPRGVKIPRLLIGKNIVHLPTMKTHVFTTITGAMKNAFGGLLGFERHWTHGVIHETLVDLLVIQRQIHPGLFAVMDATLSGDGPGPRAMRPYITDYILASGDPVALDAVAARMMGFDPLSLKFIRLAHDRGLGCGDPREIEIAGADIAEVNFRYRQTDTFASRGQKLIYHGALKPFERALLQSPIVPWSFAASHIYHNVFWLPLIGRSRIQRMLDTAWGKLFQQYGE
jgi:uncharacterized protein (DUF362 family)